MWTSILRELILRDSIFLLESSKLIICTNPIALNLGSINIYWYGVIYALSAYIASQLFSRYMVDEHGMSADEASACFFWMLLGTIVGAKVLSALLFDSSVNKVNIVREIFVGNSFHGGIIGMTCFLYVYCWINGIRCLTALDGISYSIPPALGLGRIGNFINQEFYGEPTSDNLGVVFCSVDNQARVPVQLYEAAVEGCLLFVVLLMVRKIAPDSWKGDGILTSVFLLGYGLARVILEPFKVVASERYYGLSDLLIIRFLSAGMMLLGLAILLHAVSANRHRA